MFNWDEEYENAVQWMAEYALMPHWVEYMRDYVKNMEQTHPMLKGLGKDVKRKMDEIRSKGGCEPGTSD